ncbi:extracellular solute-binding protein [Nonomuraea angiospora]|uniref:Raffinose/stachyose/melibiose transport system substrate-binding protein n=1 Tax=Nonomuraea angiospora TaxID=46172 RepID=A0ABR9M1X9_9ACTN|nr:extracellular solute-binding protein [Nonomuraea angiospora]MBE1586587.1 raffinose/stachyose/melibiose transport system substrate-binding protein [Nonomuraea angiospora]
MVTLRRTKRLAAVATSLAAAGLLTACVPGTSGEAPATTSAAGPIATDPAKMGKVQLRLLDYFTGGTDLAWIDGVVSAFQKKYPDITIERTPMPWDDVMKALPLKLRSANPPDIVPANNGWQSLGTLVQGGLVRNLDDYADAYGWRTRFPASILRQHQFSADGKQMGTGSVFGSPVARASAIEVYYNRSLLDRIGAAVPKTFADFETALAKAKSAGITPISIGNLEQVGITGPLFATMDALGQQSRISDFIYSQNAVKVADTGFPQATAALKQWADKGYFTKDFSAVPGQDAAQAFVDGKALFRFDYSGSLPLKKGQSKNFGSFLMPRADGGHPVATASSATNFSISAKSAHPDAAAAFMNFAASPEAAQLAADNTTMPLLAPVKPAGDDPLFADDVAVAAQLSADDASVPYLDWATPTLLTTIQTQMQDMLAGKVQPDAVVQAAQADYDKFQKTLGK